MNLQHSINGNKYGNCGCSRVFFFWICITKFLPIGIKYEEKWFHSHNTMLNGNLDKITRLLLLESARTAAIYLQNVFRFGDTHNDFSTSVTNRSPC